MALHLVPIEVAERPESALDMIDSQPALAHAYCAFYQAHKEGREALEAMKLALHAARRAALAEWEATQQQDRR